MGPFDWLFAKRRFRAEAQRAEAAGELARAAELWIRAGEGDQAARALLVLGDGEAGPERRLPIFVRAVHAATPGSAVQREARIKRARLLVALASDTPTSAKSRHDLSDAAKELLELDLPDEAALVFALVGNHEGRAAALVRAGDVDQLEAFLSSEEERRRRGHARAEAESELSLCLSEGRRREALGLAESIAEKYPEDARARERCSELRARRLTSPVVEVRLGHETVVLVLGREVVLGRSDATLVVPSPAVSRHHLRIGRDRDVAFVEDLGTKNGTFFRGLRLSGPILIDREVELRLGGEVEVAISPTERPVRGVAIRVDGKRTVAPLGPADLGDGLVLTRGADGWAELHSRPGSAFIGETEIASVMTLLEGDSIALARNGPASLTLRPG